MKVRVNKSSLNGSIRVPGSKSHTIRAVLMAAMAEGTSVIEHPLTSLDCQSAMTAAEAFGAETSMGDGVWTVTGHGSRLKTPENYVDCGNSGSTAYFTASMAALADGYTCLTGDQQIRKRPIRPVLDAVVQLGGEAFTTRRDVDACPAVIGGRMKGGTVHFKKSLSQFVSSIMLVAPLLEHDTEIYNEDPLEKPYLQITIDWLNRFGVRLLENSGDYSYFKIPGNQTYHGIRTQIPSDWSAVAFPLVAAVITPSEVVIEGVDFLDSQGDKMVADHLRDMGADIVKDQEGKRLIIHGGKTLKGGTTIDLSDIPDSLPALSVAALFAEHDTTFTGLAHIRLKETDRVAVMEEELKKTGAQIETGSDFMVVHGGGTVRGARVNSHGDHRIAMALAVCGLAAEGTMTVDGGECAAVSFPTFFEGMKGLGADFCLEDQEDREAE